MGRSLFVYLIRQHHPNDGHVVSRTRHLKSHIGRHVFGMILQMLVDVLLLLL